MNVFPMKKKACRTSGFTLIEMLVVILIVIVLMGIVFRLSKVSSNAGAASSTTARLEALKAAVEEYYAEYGMYPPVAEEDGVQPIGFRYPYRLPSDTSSRATDLFKWGLLSFLKNRKALVGATDIATNDELFKPGSEWEKGHNKPSGRGGLHGQELENWPSARDVVFLNRIDPFLKKAGVWSDTSRRKNDKNRWDTTISAQDAWYNEWVYISKPPYQSYALFSRGADGRPTNDELKALAKSGKVYDPWDLDFTIGGAFVNKDNIYGNVGDSK